MHVEDDGKSVFWVCTLLLLFLIKSASSGTESKKEEEFAYVHFMEVTKPIWVVGKSFECICLRWATGDEIDRTLDIARYAGQDSISAG